MDKQQPQSFNAELIHLHLTVNKVACYFLKPSHPRLQRACDLCKSGLDGDLGSLRSHKNRNLLWSCLRSRQSSARSRAVTGSAPALPAKSSSHLSPPSAALAGNQPSLTASFSVREAEAAGKTVWDQEEEEEEEGRPPPTQDTRLWSGFTARQMKTETSVFSQQWKKTTKTNHSVPVFKAKKIYKKITWQRCKKVPC